MISSGQRSLSCKEQSLNLWGERGWQIHRNFFARKKDLCKARSAEKRENIIYQLSRRCYRIAPEKRKRKTHPWKIFNRFFPKSNNLGSSNWNHCWSRRRLQLSWFQNRIWWRRVRIRKCVRKRSLVGCGKRRQKYQGFRIHLRSIKKLNCSVQGKSCMRSKVMIML